MPLDLAPPIAEQRRDAQMAIDERAGEVRRQYLTTVPGQAETYREKLADCQNYLSQLLRSALTGTKNYPWVAAEAEAQNMTARAAAENVVATYEQWRAMGIKIEKARIAGKRAVREAPDTGVAKARSQALALLRSLMPDDQP